MASRKIPLLIVTSYFPPMSHIAAFRTEAYAKYLDKEKFEIYVIARKFSRDTPDDIIHDGCRVQYLTAKSLMRDLTIQKASNVFFHRLWALKNKIVFNFLLDESPDFTAKALRASEQLIREKDIKVVLTSFGPLSLILLGLKLKHAHPNLLWVSDLRDEVARAPKISHFLKAQVEKVETEMMKMANIIVSVSKPILESLSGYEKYQEKCIEVRNGFDYEPRRAKAAGEKDVWNITYAGSFYGVINPEQFFKALTTFLQIHSAARVAVKVFGGSGGVTVPDHLKSTVQIHNKVAHAQIIAELEKADAFLLIYPTDNRRGVYTGKLFDYLGIDRPILGLVNPQDVAADLIRETNAGYVVDNADTEGIVKVLTLAYRHWQDGGGPLRKWDVVLKHQRKNQVARLTERIENCLKGLT